MTEQERQLREKLAEAQFHNKVLTWLAAGFCLAFFVALAWR